MDKTSESRAELRDGSTALRQAIQSALPADANVQISDDLHASVRFRNYSSQHVSVIETTVDRPIRAGNGPTSTADVYVISLKRGRLQLMHSAGTVTMSPGEFVVFPGRSPLQLVHGPSTTILGVRISGHFLRHWLPDWEFIEFIPLQDGGAEERLAFDMAGSLLDCGARIQSDSASLVGETIGRLLARSLGQKSLIDRGPPGSLADVHRRRVKQYCLNNLATPDLSIDAIARATGLSSPHVYRLFKDEPLTLRAWIQEQRLEHARTAIERDPLGTRTLTDIALTNGFADVAHLSHAFKRRYDCSPRALRGAAGQSSTPAAK